MAKEVIVSEVVRQDVAHLLFGMIGKTKMQMGKILVKSFSQDKKLVNFFKAKFDSGITLLTNESTLEKMFETLEDHDLTDVRKKQAAIIAMRDADVEEEVKAKIKELTLDGALALSEAQKEQLAAKAIEYRNFLKDGMTKGLIKLGLYTGALEEKIEVLVAN